MAIYAIGDVQGCYAELRQLLDKIDFNTEQDQLWFVGDLVNRGQQSLETLRFIKSLGQQAICVLGNHDLHLLAVAKGIKTTRSRDLQRILDSNDRDELVDWLSHRPLLHHDAQHNFTLVHAGIYPGWTLTQAQTYARELEHALQNNLTAFLQKMYGDEPARWNVSLDGYDRLRFICNSFTRMRYIRSDYSLDHQNKMAPDNTDTTTRPWFEISAKHNTRIIFGHWSTLPLTTGPDIYAIDTGCVWGGCLTAYCLDTGQVTQLDCQQYSDPRSVIANAGQDK